MSYFKTNTKNSNAVIVASILTFIFLIGCSIAPLGSNEVITYGVLFTVIVIVPTVLIHAIKFSMIFFLLALNDLIELCKNYNKIRIL